MRPRPGTGGLTAIMTQAAAGPLALEGFSDPTNTGNRGQATEPRFARVRRAVELVARKPSVSAGDLPIEVLPLAPSTGTGK